jgi:predicted RNA-binding Zn-ribbon protein involved in translation (DUF1610 family)
MPVRTKGKKRKVLTNKLTIDQLHKSKYNEIENVEKIKKEYEDEIKDLETKLNLLKKNTLGTNGIPKMDIECKIWDIEDRINYLRTKIDSLQNNECKYLLHSSKILKSYYKMVKKEEETIKQLHEADFSSNKSINKCEKNNNTVSTSVSFTIFDKLDAASSKKYDSSKTIDNKKNDIEQLQNKTQNVNNINQQTIDTTFNKLYNKYMKVIDPKYIKKFENTVLNICKNCNTDMVLNHNTGLFNCQNCGLCRNVIIDTDKQNHKEPPKEMTSFSYRRINHLNEILSQIQGKETTDIPKEIYDEIYSELRKERFTDISKLTTDKLKKVLKKIGRSKYYEHIPYMVIQMGGIPPPIISPEVEEIIRDIFLKMQHPFNNCDKERTNFLTYTGVLYKIFELLDMDHYLKNFKFLKDDKKQYYQEQIWKQICEELGWEFIPSS